MAALKQGLFKRHGNGALPATGEPCEPEGGASLIHQSIAIVATDFSVMPMYVGCFLLGHGSVPVVDGGPVHPIFWCS